MAVRGEQQKQSYVALNLNDVLVTAAHEIISEYFLEDKIRNVKMVSFPSYTSRPFSIPVVSSEQLSGGSAESPGNPRLLDWSSWPSITYHHGLVQDTTRSSGMFSSQGF